MMMYDGLDEIIFGLTVRRQVGVEQVMEPQRQFMAANIRISPTVIWIKCLRLSRNQSPIVHCDIKTTGNWQYRLNGTSHGSGKPFSAEYGSFKIMMSPIDYPLETFDKQLEVESIRVLMERYDIRFHQLQLRNDGI